MLLQQPEWLRQRVLVGQGKATWDDFSIEEKTCRGWLLPYLYEIDVMFSKRWDYWLRTLEAKKLLDEPIPRIAFLGSPNAETKKMIEDCVGHYYCTTSSIRFPDFIEWLLWAFGEVNERPSKVSAKVSEHWYRTFNLGLLLKYPHDYFGFFLGEDKNSWWNNPHAFYPTPHDLVETMVAMTMAGNNGNKTASVYDPCLGTGRMLLHASNYSLVLYGQDIDPVCIMASKVNAFLYVPWMIKPALWLQKENNVVIGDSLVTKSERPRLLSRQPKLRSKLRR